MASDSASHLSVPTAFSTRLDFDPSRDGFSFRNHFKWTPADLTVLDKRLRPLSAAAVGAATAVGGAIAGPVGAGAGAAVGTAIGATGIGGSLIRSVARRWSSFGLCGGMALAAIERWPSAGRVPTADLPQDTMRPLLRRRQEATLKASLVRFGREWVRARRWGARDAPLAADLARELDRISETLAGGRPALIGLIGDAPDPFALHQIVVFGIHRTGPVAATLDVYDPNAPGKTHTITIAPGEKAGFTHLTTSMPTGVRDNGGVHISTRRNGLTHLFEIRP